MTFESKYFTEAETVVTRQAGIKNIYKNDQAIIDAVQGTARYMDMVRALLNAPIVVSSWYRSPELNKKVGGSPRSQHMKGEAVDFICPKFGTPMAIVKYLERAGGIDFDQLIMEGTWVHISFCTHVSTTRKPRRQVIYL